MEKNTTNLKIKTLYQQFINTSSRSDKELREIVTQVINESDLTNSIIIMHNLGLGTLFSFYPSQDRKDASMMIGTLGCAQVGLPDRDYYLEKKHTKLLEKYTQYIEELLQVWYQDIKKAKKPFLIK